MIGSDAALTAGLIQAGATRQVLDALCVEGEEARIIGGAVRNILMGRPVTDIDIATTRLPENVMRLAAARGWRAIPTGIEHGTVTILLDGEAFEVTTLREDIATDGRHAVVRFGRDFRADAARRDFTMNALSLGRDGNVHDYFGGRADIAARRVRFIGDPDQRLREDYLRGLRFLRFSAEYGDGVLDAAGLAAVIRQRDGLSYLSGERVRQELLKLLLAARGTAVVRLAEVPHGLLSGLLGGATLPDRLAGFLDFAAAAGLGPPSAMARLHALAVHADADVARLQSVLKLSNREEAMLSALQSAGALLAGGATLPHLFYRHPDVAAEAIVLEALDEPLADPAKIGEDLRAISRDRRVFTLSGRDILGMGLAPGPEVGAILAAAEARWIEMGLPPQRETQEALLERMVAERRGA